LEAIFSYFAKIIWIQSCLPNCWSCSNSFHTDVFLAF
jgi:hypothetical protein